MAKRILVIDDDPDILEILDIIFTQEGYDVILSETGREAENILEINPDLVVLDIMIAGSDKSGAAICAKIKSRPETQNLPVIMFSSEENIREISEECGANGYASKPVQTLELISKVKAFLAA
jgi:two-component system response regulator VicR